MKMRALRILIYTGYEPVLKHHLENGRIPDGGMRECERVIVKATTIGKYNEYLRTIIVRLIEYVGEEELVMKQLDKAVHERGSQQWGDFAVTGQTIYRRIIGD